MAKTRSTGHLVVTSDNHFNDYPRFPAMFGHLQDVFRDTVNFTVAQGSGVLIDLGDTADMLNGSIPAKVLDPLCELYSWAGKQVQIHKIKGNHARGPVGTGDHLETPLGFIEGVTIYDDPTGVELLGFYAFFVPYTEDRDEFVDIIRSHDKVAKDYMAKGWPCIAFTHQGYFGGWVGPDEPGYRPNEEDGAWDLPGNIFKYYHQVFSGHFHKHQTFYVGDTPVTYIGAPLQHNFGDRGQPRGFVEITANGQEISFRQHAHDPKYPVFLKPTIDAKTLSDWTGDQAAHAYVQPICVDPNVSETEISKIKAYKLFPTIWDVPVAGKNRLGITHESTAEEIISGYVEVVCQGLDVDAKDALFALGLDIYYKSRTEVKTAYGNQGPIELLELELHNFRRTTSVTIPLKNRGVLAFVGENGAGKSTIRYALLYVLFGETPGNSESVINRKLGKDTCVKLVLSIGGIVYTIIRYRKHSKYKDKLFFFMGTEVPPEKDPSNLTCSSNPLTQKLILQYLGTDLEMFQAVVCVSRMVKLASAEMSDGDKRLFLEKAFGLTEWSLPEEYVKSLIKNHNAHADSLRTAIASAERLKDSVNMTLGSLSLQSGQWESQKRKRLSDLRAEEIQVDQRISKAQEKNVMSPETLATKLAEAKDKLEELPRDGEPERKKYLTNKSQLSEKIGSEKGRKAVAAADVERLEREKQAGLPLRSFSSEDGIQQACPTCKQPVTKEHVDACRKEFLAIRQKAITDARAKIEVSEGRLRELNRLMDALDIRLAGIDSNILARRALKDQIHLLTEKHNEQKDISSQQKRLIDGLLKQKQDVERRRQVIKEEGDPYAELVLRSQKERDGAEQEIQEKSGALVDAKAYMDSLLFWAKGFSKQGLRSHLLDIYLPDLTASIQKQLDELHDGTLRVNLSAQRASDDGKIQERFTVEVANVRGGGSYDEQSGGEAHRIDIAIILGVISHARKVRRHSFSAVLLDDIIDTYLDDRGASALGRLINAFATDLWLGVVTHKASLAAMFDRRVLVARDEQDFSSYTWR